MLPLVELLKVLTPELNEWLEVKARCPYCRTVARLMPIHVEIKDVHIRGSGTVGLRQCPDDTCRALLLYVQRPFDAVELYPPETIDFDASNLPPGVLASLSEAITCHANQCYRATAIMIRRTLEELCHHKEVKGSDLHARLEALKGVVTLPPALIDGLTNLRLLGNDAAHIEAKTYEDVGEDEVRIGIDITKVILQSVYQLGDIVSRLDALKKRQADNGPASTG